MCPFLCQIHISPEHQAEVEPFLPDQVASKPVGGRVGQEDNTLGKSIAGTIDVCLFKCSLVWRIQLGLVHLHEVALLPQAGDGADVVQGLARDLQDDTQEGHGHVNKTVEFEFEFVMRGKKRNDDPNLKGRIE